MYAKNPPCMFDRILKYASELASKCKLRKFVSFHSHTKPVFGQVLVHSVDKTHVLVVTVALIWLLFLNILSFNFVQMPNKSLRFRRFSRSYVNHPVVASTTIKVAQLFCLMFAIQTGPVPFLQLIDPNNSAFAYGAQLLCECW